MYVGKHLCTADHSFSSLRIAARSQLLIWDVNSELIGFVMFMILSVQINTARKLSQFQS